MTLRFRDLEPEERALICNGCGGKGHWFNPPDWLFKASCDHHDFNYWLGHTEEDRRRADWQFYVAMVGALLQGRQAVGQGLLLLRTTGANTQGSGGSPSG
jgi:hypothetical protein